MRQQHFLLLHLAIGGDQGGDPTATAFPVRYEIDYVRVYRADHPTPDQTTAQP